MAGYFYVYKDTGYFTNTISSVEQDHPNLLQVPSLPPNQDHRWDGEKWVAIDSAETIKVIGSETEKAIAQILAPDPESQVPSIEETKASGILKFDDLNLLNIGNNVDEWDSLDILHYKDVNPIPKSKGIYTKSKGYLAFPSLAWDSTKTKTTSFVWYCSSDSRYFVFGLASKERFNWNSNDFNKCEIGLRFRTYRGSYYGYGLTKNNQHTLSFKGYEGFEALAFYRLDFPNNGSQGESALLYQLKDGEPSSWLGGELAQEISLAQSPSRTGKTLTPFIGEYLGSNNYLLGVIVR